MLDIFFGMNRTVLLKCINFVSITATALVEGQLWPTFFPLDTTTLRPEITTKLTTPRRPTEFPTKPSTPRQPTELPTRQTTHKQNPTDTMKPTTRMPMTTIRPTTKRHSPTTKLPPTRTTKLLTTPAHSTE